jgi:hypothetical protein
MEKESIQNKDNNIIKYKTYNPDGNGYFIETQALAFPKIRCSGLVNRVLNKSKKKEK